MSERTTEVTPLFRAADPTLRAPAQRRLDALLDLIAVPDGEAALVPAALLRAAPDIVSAEVFRAGELSSRWPLEDAAAGPLLLTADDPATHTLLLPLRPGPDRVGVLVLGLDGEPDDELLTFLDTVAVQVAALLAGTTTPATARRLELLQQATAELSASATPEQVVDVTRRHLARLLATPAVAVWETDGGVLRSSAMSGWGPTVVRDWTSLPLAGETPVADAARGPRTVLLEHDDDWARDYPHLQDVIAASGYRGLAVWPLVVAGESLGAVAAGFPGPRTLGAEERATAAALVEQCAQAVARARLLQAESDGRRYAVRLSAALSALSAAVDLPAVAAVLLDQAVAAGAVAAVVTLHEEEHVEAVASVGFPGDPPRRLTGPGPLVADRTGPAWTVTPGPLWGAPTQTYPVHSVIPLVVAGVRTGSLGIVWRADPPGPAQRSLIETVAGQGAQALARARMQQAEHEVAVTLQRVLLPAVSPRLERLAVATRYLPAGPGAQAGGDWYDVIPLDGERVAIVVGDVVGHGPHAAGVMGQLRSALAAYLLDDHGPAEALERLDRFARRVDGAAASTVACGVLDRGTGELCWARAGHVPALVVDAAGSRFLDSGSGTVLGVRGRPPFTEERTVLAPGASVVLYTDGLVERRGEDIDTGLDRLEHAAGGLRHLAPERLASTLLDRCLGGGPADDVAVVVIRLLPPPLRRRRPADPAELSHMRREVREWAAAAALPDEQLEDLQLTLGEAVANAVEHAYRDRRAGEVDYGVAVTGDGGVEVEVRDGGHWRPPPADPGYRGRGLLIIDRIARAASIEGSDDGTVVRFTVPPAAVDTS